MLGPSYLRPVSSPPVFYGQGLNTVIVTMSPCGPMTLPVLTQTVFGTLKVLTSAERTLRALASITPPVVVCCLLSQYPC
jgi:hypothetical protein